MTKRENTKNLTSKNHKLKITTPESRSELIYEIVRILLGLVFGIFAFTVSHFLIFLNRPLLGVTYVGDIVVGSLAFAVVYYLTPLVLKAVGEAIQNIVSKQLYDSVSYLTTKASVKRKNKKPKIKKLDLPPFVLDTSAIIDGRVVVLISEQFVVNQIVIPQFVLDELQTLSDSKTKKTRDTGRRGLSKLEEIKKVCSGNFVVYPTDESKDVDKDIILLTKKLKGRLVTTDYNLGKVAQVKGVSVFNINTLANSLKISVVPGDLITLEIQKKGSNRKQGVGYLKDGTMVVVTNADKHVNKFVNVEVTKILQKPTGGMVFGELVEIIK